MFEYSEQDFLQRKWNSGSKVVSDMERSISEDRIRAHREITKNRFETSIRKLFLIWKSHISLILLILGKDQLKYYHFKQKI